MKVLKAVGILIISVLLFGGLYLLNAMGRYDLKLNPVVEEIRSDPNVEAWGDRTTLIPSQFDLGDDRDNVLRKLEKAGFERVPDGQAWVRYQYEIDEGREIYTREAHNIACNIYIYVFIDFSDKNKLTFAEGTQHEHGCL